MANTLDQNHRSPALKEREIEQPNLPEVSGTTFPLLTTLLAGFAVTIAVQLIIRPDATDSVSGLIPAAIVVFLTSMLLFISSIVFAVNAQAYNYLPFMDISDRSQALLNVDDVHNWMSLIEGRWARFHQSALLTLYGGIALLLLGVNLTVWEFVGPLVGTIVTVVIAFNIVLTTIVTRRIHQFRHQTGEIPDAEASN